MELSPDNDTCNDCHEDQRREQPTQHTGAAENITPEGENNKPENTSAFPYNFSMGMTLRDYFAAKAMQTLMNEANDIARTKLWIAITSYAMADAMLKERTA